MNRVAGKVALLTGAGMGLGRAAALLLAAEGAKVVVTDIDVAAARETAELITRWRRKPLASPAFDPATGAVMAAVEQKFGRLDVLVNNAGIAIAKNIEDTSLQDWRRTMAVNLDGVFFGCQQGIALMKQSGGGSIVNLSSIDGIIGEADLAAYCASKGGVRTLTKAVAVHCAEKRYGIRCNSIHPGYIWTPQTENYLRDLGTLDREAQGPPVTRASSASPTTSPTWSSTSRRTNRGLSPAPRWSSMEAILRCELKIRGDHAR